MANEQNLKPGEYELTLEEQKKGGIASGKARREKKLIRDNIELLLSLPVKDNKIKDKLLEQGFKDDELTNQMALVMALYKKAMTGDVNAFNSLRDTIGQKPVERVETTEIPKIVDDVE